MAASGSCIFDAVSLLSPPGRAESGGTNGAAETVRTAREAIKTNKVRFEKFIVLSVRRGWDMSRRECERAPIL